MVILDYFTWLKVPGKWRHSSQEGYSKNLEVTSQKLVKSQTILWHVQALDNRGLLNNPLLYIHVSSHHPPDQWYTIIGMLGSSLALQNKLFFFFDVVMCTYIAINLNDYYVCSPTHVMQIGEASYIALKKKLNES